MSLQLLEQGNVHLEAGEYHDALDCFNRMIEQAPNRFVGYQARAKAAWGLGRRADALRDIDHAVRLAADNPLLLAERADYHFRQRAFASAIADCDKVLSLDPGWAPIQGLRGECHAALGDTPAALRDLSEALAADPPHAMHYHSARAKLLLDCEDWQACCRECDAILLLNADHFHAHQWRGLAHRELQELPTAYEDLTRALAIRPESTLTRLARALVQQEVGSLPGAMEDCEIILKREPDNVHARQLWDACRSALKLD